MLQNLHVKNLALIDEIEITFDEHLNILTGETGAGKSVLIGSIESALGKKISKDMISPGAKEAVIELLFWIEDEKLIKETAYQRRLGHRHPGLLRHRLHRPDPGAPGDRRRIRTLSGALPLPAGFPGPDS